MLLKHIDELAQDPWVKSLVTDKTANIEIWPFTIDQPTNATNEKININWFKPIGGITTQKGNLALSTEPDIKNKVEIDQQNFATNKTTVWPTLCSGRFFDLTNNKTTINSWTKSALQIGLSQTFTNWAKLNGLTTPTRLPIFVNKTNKRVVNAIDTNTSKATQTIKWALPIVGTTLNGIVILGIINNDPALSAQGIDTEKSVELHKLFQDLETTSTKGQPQIPELQKGSGQGKAINNQEVDTTTLLTTNSPCEIIRILGHKLNAQNDAIKTAWSLLTGNSNNSKNGLLNYRIEAGEHPDPNTSRLLIFPKENCQLFAESILEQNIQRYTKANKEIDTESKPKRNILPKLQNGNATIALIGEEGSNQKKWTTSTWFKNISILEWNIFESYIQKPLQHIKTKSGWNKKPINYIVIPYMLTAITAIPDSDNKTSSTTQILTLVIQGILGKKELNTESYWKWLPSAIRNSETHNAENSKRQSLKDTVSQLLEIIDIFKTVKALQKINWNNLSEDNIEINLNNLKNGKLKMNLNNTQTEKCPATAENIIGKSLYEALPKNAQAKTNKVMTDSWGGIPEKDFTTFLRGVATGAYFQLIEYKAEQLKASFNVTRGIHVSAFRGKLLQESTNQWIGIMRRFKGKESVQSTDNMPAHIAGMEQESKKEAFNTGLAIGMVTWVEAEKSEDTKSAENNNQ